MRGRLYDIVFVGDGWQFRARPRFAGALELTLAELLALTAVAYLQPATRAELSRLAVKEISRDSSAG